MTETINPLSALMPKINCKAYQFYYNCYIDRFNIDEMYGIVRKNETWGIDGFIFNYL